MPELVESLRGRVGRRTLLRSGALGGAGLAAAALIGCGGDDEGDESPAAGTSGTQAATTQTAAQLPGLDVAGKRIPYNFPEPAGKTPKAGGNLVVAVTWEPSVLDPSKSAAGGTVTVPNTTNDRLLGFKRGPEVDPLKLELVPELAQSWENTPDGLTYTFRMKPGVKWQNVAPLNGRAFTAADVKFSYDRYAKEGVHKSYFTNVKSIDAPDANTLKITLNKPQPDFLIPLGSRYLSIHSKELVDANEIDKKSIGTGPMVISEIQPGAVKFNRNPEYWNGTVKPDTMEYRVITDASAQTAAFRAGQIDFGYVVGTTPEDYEQLIKSNPNIQGTATSPVNSTFAISFNLDNPLYKDERIRRAVSLSMDRAELNRVLYRNTAVALPTLPWIFVFDKQPTVESGQLGKWWKTDHAEAKKLLQAAGQENLSLPMIFYNYGDASNSRPNEVLVDQMRRSGIRLDAKRTDYTEFNSQWVGAKFPEVADGWAAQGFDTDNFFYLHLRSDSPGNRWRIKDAELDTWAEQQRSELNPQARKEILKKMWDKTLDQMYRVEKPAQSAITVYQPWLRGYRAVGVLGSNSYYYDWGAQLNSVWLDK